MTPRVHYALAMIGQHASWRELAAESLDGRIEAHLDACDLCRQRLLKLLYEDMAPPVLKNPFGAAIQADLALRHEQAMRAFDEWPRWRSHIRDARTRVRLRSRTKLNHLPMAEIVLQEARQAVRSRPREARVFASLALDLIEELEEPALLLADARSQAFLFLAEASRRLGDLGGRSLAEARRKLEAGTGCAVLEAEWYSASASYLVDVGSFHHALEHIDLAIEGFRVEGKKFQYAVALVKRANILSRFDPEEGIRDAKAASRWIAQHGIRNTEVGTAAVRTRIDCLIEAGRPKEALHLLLRHQRRLFPEDAPRLLEARMQVLSAKLLFQVNLPFEGELILEGAIEALARHCPQEALRANLVLLRHQARVKRWSEAKKTAEEIELGLRAVRHPNPKAMKLGLVFNLLGWGRSSRGPCKAVRLPG